MSGPALISDSKVPISADLQNNQEGKTPSDTVRAGASASFNNSASANNISSAASHLFPLYSSNSSHPNNTYSATAAADAAARRSLITALHEPSEHAQRTHSKVRLLSINGYATRAERALRETLLEAKTAKEALRLAINALESPSSTQEQKEENSEAVLKAKKIFATLSILSAIKIRQSPRRIGTSCSSAS